MCIIIFSYKKKIVCIFKQDKSLANYSSNDHTVHCIALEDSSEGVGHTLQHHYLASFPTHMKKVPSATVLY